MIAVFMRNKYEKRLNWQRFLYIELFKCGAESVSVPHFLYILLIKNDIFINLLTYSFA